MLRDEPSGAFDLEHLEPALAERAREINRSVSMDEACRRVTGISEETGQLPKGRS